MSHVSVCRIEILNLWNTYLISATQSSPPSGLVTQGIGNADLETVMYSPGSSMQTSLPSIDSSDGALDRFEICFRTTSAHRRPRRSPWKCGNDPPRTCIFNEHSLGNNNVLKLKLLGAIGVRRNESMVGCMIGPPAESEYAVDPVGVARMSPSACCNPNPKPQTPRQCQNQLHRYRYPAKKTSKTHDGLCQMLIIHKRIYDAQMGVPSSMQCHLIHNLPACFIQTYRTPPSQLRPDPSLNTPTPTCIRTPFNRSPILTKQLYSQSHPLYQPELSSHYI
jgi:hypothetical protein